MSKSLGINVKVNFDEAMRALDNFEKRWQKIGKEELKLKVKVDDQKIKGLDKMMKRLENSDKDSLKLKVDTKSAVSKLEEFRSKFDSVKKDIEKGIDMKLGSKDLGSRGMDAAARNGKSLTAGLKEAHSTTMKINRSHQELNGYAAKFARTSIAGAEKTRSSYDRLTKSRAEGSRSAAEMAKREKASLKEIINLTKEIGRIEKQSIGKSDGEKNVMTTRISSLNKELDKYTRNHQKAFGKSANDNWSVKQAQDLAKYNVELKQSAQLVKKLAADDKAAFKARKSEQKEYYSDLRRSISRTNQLNNQLSKAGTNEARAIEDAIAAEKKKQSAIKETIRIKQLSNKESDREIAKSERIQTERQQEANAIAKGARKDRREGGFGVLETALDPRNLYREGRQAAMLMYDSVATLDKEFTDIAKVADVPSQVLDNFSKDIFKQATAVGKSADEYATSVARWLVTGKTFKESQELSQVSVMGGFVGNIGEEEMVQYMSVPLQSFKKEALEAKDVINAMNEVSNNNAIEMNDLGLAYERAGQTAASAGTSFSQLTGMITGANVQTRAGGEKIGTALKAVDLNFNKISTGVSKADTDRNAFFKNIGVELKDENQQLRSTYDILGDLSKVWDGLSSDDKGLATLYAAGKNHASILQGIVTGWDDVVKATGEAEQQVGLVNKDSGSAFQEFDKQKESVEYKANALKNSWNELLNTIAGGRDGVNGVLEIMTKMVDAGVQLANNDGFMRMAGAFVKMTAAASGLIGVKKVFGMFNSAFGGMGSALANMKMMTKLSGNLKTFGLGGGKALSGLAARFGSLIPVIGGVIAVLGTLDALGIIDVWGTLGKAVSGVGKAFESTSKKAKKANNEFVESHQKYQKEIGENQYLNGTLKQVGDVYKNFDELRKKKQTAFDNGETNSLSFSEKEFETLQQQVAQMSDKLGVDIQLEMNDFDHIVGQFDKLIELKNQLTDKEVIKGLETLQEAAKPQDLTDAVDAWKKDKKDLETTIKSYKTDIPEAQRDADNGLRTQKSVDDMKGYQKEAEQQLREISSFQRTQEAIEAKKAAIEKRITMDQLKQGFGSQFEDGSLVLPKKDPQMVKDGMTTVLSYAKQAKEETNALTKARDDIQQAYDKWNGANGQQQDKNARVSKETLDQIKQIFPEKKNISNNVDTWGDGFDKIAIDKFNASTEEANKRTGDFKQKLVDLAQASGVTKDELNKMTAALEGSGSDFVKHMLEQGDVGAGMLGISDVFQATEGWEDIVIDLQAQLDKTGDIEKAIKFKVATEDGLVNGEMLDEIASIPEEITTELNIIDGNGNINLENTLNMIEKINEAPLDKELKAKFSLPDGTVSLEKLGEVWGDLDDSERKELKVALDIEGEEKLKDVGDTQKDLDGKKTSSKHDAKTEGKEDLEEVDKKQKELDGKSSKSKHDTKVDGKDDLEEVDKKQKDMNGKSSESKVEVKAEGKDEFAELKEFIEEVKVSIAEIDGKTASLDVEARVKNLEKAKEAQKVVNEIDGDYATVTIKAEDQTFQAVVDAKGNILSVDGRTATAVLDADGTLVGSKVITATGEILTFDGVTGLGKLDADNNPVESKVAISKSSIDGINNYTGTATIDGNDSPLRSTIGGISSIPIPSVSVVLRGVMDGILSRFFGGGASGSATVNVKGKETKSKSVNVLDRNMAKSFSSSITEAVGGTSASTSTTKGKSSSKSSSKSDNKPINSDVWRYWGKELFKGLPLERSMSNLENAIKKASDNHDKLIPLYKQQISLMNQQIAFQKTMQKESQSEMNEVLGKLRGKGFKTKGNQITNLGRAKAFKGEAATDVEELLNKWKKLYEGLDEITGKINSLNQQKWDKQQEIKDAQIAKEAKALENRLKKTTALLTAIESHMSILSKKDGLVSEMDYELKLTVQEEATNDAKKNIGMLIDEFNKLSKTNIKYGENADVVKKELESLKDQIISNSDAIIAYRESMNQLKIDRLIADYDKFSETLQRNTNNLKTNVEALREGLVSGTNFSDLKSSNLENVLFNRKNALDKQYQDRLRLEGKLDSALEAFSKKNVDRAKNVANAQLQIEKKKYNELLKMQKSYSNGKTPTYKEVKGNFDIGSIKTEQTKNNKEYQDWLNKLKKANNQYTSEFSKMRDQYEKDMKKADNQAKKDSLTNQFIIDQMKLQEKIQSDIVKLNDEAIAQAQTQLKDATLTTEQREALEDAIREYKDASIEAQESIRDIIKNRFDFEFEQMDKAIEKATSYSEKLDHLFEVSSLVDSNPRNRETLLDKIYESKANEYYMAKKALKSLQDQQSKFTEGSLEWGLLQDKIENVDKSVKDLTISLLEANKKILGNKLDIMGEDLSKEVLGGKTLDEWKDYRDRWATGVEKEIELEKIRRRLLEIESDVNKERLEVLDRQEAVSKKELEYLDKQTKVLELQNKINNLDKERSVQTLVKKDDGTWDWDYVADQSEIDKAKEDLKEAEKDLDKYKEDQREKYVSDIQKALEKAKNGGFENSDDLKKELDDIRQTYGEILTGMPETSMGSIDDIISAYEDYLEENSKIVNDALNNGEDKEFENRLEKIGGMFETSFKAIAEDLGKIISDALSTALGSVTGFKRLNSEQPYIIQNQELVFPNVTDTEGFEQVLLDLPQKAQQQINSK